jgi:hypothetical protein
MQAVTIDIMPNVTVKATTAMPKQKFQNCKRLRLSARRLTGGAVLYSVDRSNRRRFQTAKSLTRTTPLGYSPWPRAGYPSLFRNAFVFASQLGNKISSDLRVSLRTSLGIGPSLQCLSFG